MNKYQAFVKEAMAKMPASMSPQEKMSKCAEMYRNRAGISPKPKKGKKQIKGGIVSMA
jgi:hypothetical protein